jgi:hypothetical protein
MVGSRQPTGVLFPVVYLFGGKESKAKNSKVMGNWFPNRSIRRRKQGGIEDALIE